MSSKVESFQDLIVWQKAHKLAQDIFTAKFSKGGKFLGELTKERILDIPSNIAIGFKKRNKKAKVHFYREALVALEEVNYLFILAKDLDCLKNAATYSEELENINGHIRRLIRSNLNK